MQVQPTSHAPELQSELDAVSNELLKTRGEAALLQQKLAKAEKAAAKYSKLKAETTMLTTALKMVMDDLQSFTLEPSAVNASQAADSASEVGAFPEDSPHPRILSCQCVSK